MTGTVSPTRCQILGGLREAGRTSNVHASYASHPGLEVPGGSGGRHVQEFKPPVVPPLPLHHCVATVRSLPSVLWMTVCSCHPPLLRGILGHGNDSTSPSAPSPFDSLNTAGNRAGIARAVMMVIDGNSIRFCGNLAELPKEGFPDGPLLSPNLSEIFCCAASRPRYLAGSFCRPGARRLNRCEVAKADFLRRSTLRKTVFKLNDVVRASREERRDTLTGIIASHGYPFVSGIYPQVQIQGIFGNQADRLSVWTSDRPVFAASLTILFRYSSHLGVYCSTDWGREKGKNRECEVFARRRATADMIR
ncbi:hypothetical protein FB451DRAFT_1370714 [Mycena latifolia]|nr:hypothetical protein FB451DRAFT_1370714 [Mycena latifolia]